MPVSKQFEGLSPVEPTEKESQEGPTYCDVAPQGFQAFLKSFPEVNSLQSLLPLRAMKVPFVLREGDLPLFLNPSIVFSLPLGSVSCRSSFQSPVFPVPSGGYTKA